MRESAGGQLSQKLCEAWQWKQANGAPRDMVCRGLAADACIGRVQIELPPVRYTPPQPTGETRAAGWRC